MPSTMIHLLAAHDLCPEAEDLFWIGNFAPDYTNDRTIKNEIHLRNASDRLAALKQLRSTMDMHIPFEAGWLLHLFVDACWDCEMIPLFQHKYEDKCEEQHWFIKYREEIGLASYNLYHRMQWAPQVWSQIEKADLSQISVSLPVKREELEWYRDRVCSKHAQSSSELVSAEYDMDTLTKFIRETLQKYKTWLFSVQEAR